MNIVYCRCTSGHYFNSLHCPFDGWTSEAARQLDDARQKLGAEGREVTLDALRASGVPETALARCIVVSSGNDGSAFDAAAIAEYIVGPKRIVARQFGPGHF